MTIKDIADMTGHTRKTIQRKAKELFPNQIAEKSKADFTDAQSLRIVGELKFKANQGVKLGQNVAESATESRMSEMAEMAKILTPIIVEAVRVAMQPMFARFDIQQPKQIESQFIGALAYSIQNGLSTEYESVRDLGMRAARFSKLNNFPIEKIPDARWGQVNAYTRDSLRAAIV